MDIGIDVSKLALDTAALSDTGEVIRARFRNDGQGHRELITWLQAFQGPKVALEATSSYHQPLVHILQDTGLAISVLNLHKSVTSSKAITGVTRRIRPMPYGSPSTSGSASLRPRSQCLPCCPRSHERFKP